MRRARPGRTDCRDEAHPHEPTTTTMSRPWHPGDPPSAGQRVGSQAMTDDPTFFDEIEGYAGRLSYRPGQTATLHVSTSARRFDVTIQRWGAERQTVWSAEGLPGRYTPPPPDADSRGCRWPTSVEVEIPDDWRSGFYLITLAATGAPPGRDVAHAGFVVRAATRSAPVLLVLATNTWNAYNNWGGRSLYTGGTECRFQRPLGRGMLYRPSVDRDDRKARPTRWGEEPDIGWSALPALPDLDELPAGDRIVRMVHVRTALRRMGRSSRRPFRLCDLPLTSTVTPPFSTATTSCSAWATTNTGPTPSGPAWRTYVAAGGNFASFSGNTMFWRVRHEEARPGWRGHGVPQVPCPRDRSGRRRG